MGILAQIASPKVQYILVFLDDRFKFLLLKMRLLSFTDIPLLENLLWKLHTFVCVVLHEKKCSIVYVHHSISRLVASLVAFWSSSGLFQKSGFLKQLQ